LTAHTFNVPRNLFTTKSVNASASTSSAMINNGWLVLAVFSSRGTSSRMLLIFFSNNKIKALSSEASIEPASVMK